MADSPAIDTSQNDQVLPEKENHENGVRKTIHKERSINAVSAASRTKLAQLIQLASEAETEGLTNYKIVVDTVFDSLVGGHFDLEARFTIKDSSDLLMLLELLGHCNVSLKVEILGLLIAILRKSIPNLQAATKIGLTERVLCRLPQEREVVADKLVELLGILSSYSITVKELKTLLATLKGVNGKWPCHTVKLLTILKLMLEKQGPDVYFSFSGQHGAAITLPPISKWPLQSGFTFSTWLCLDTSHLANAEKRRPYLYCFRTGKGVGYSAHFSGPMLVLECAVKTGKRENKIFRHLVKFEFHPQKWYMVTVVHEHNRFHASEIRCFVNGRVVSSGKTTLVHATEPFDKCYIGSSPMADSSTVFCGQIAAVYLFSEALTAQTVGAMHRLGPGYKGQFKFPAEIDIPLSDQDRKVLYEGHLSSVIMFMYTPKACDQQLCLEASPTENHSFFCHSPHALMLEGVQSVVTHSLQSILHSLGGIQMLLPLFTQLDFPQEGAEDTSEVPEVAICTVLLSLLSDLLRRSCTSQQQMIQCQGFLVISHILEKAVSTHLTEDALGILVSLARHLLNSLSSGLLLGSLLDHILFNPNLWVKASPKVQLQLFSVFATDLATGRGCAAHMRHDVGVSRLMHMLKTFYCLDSGSKLDQDGQVQSRDGVHSLRAFLLLLVKQLVLKDKGITEEEFKSILTYLMIFDQEENLLDVLQLVLSIMTEQPDTSIPVFDKVDGLRVLFRFLDMKSEAVRVYSLKIIGCFLQFCPARRKQDLLEHFSLFSLIGDKLMNHTLTLTTYNVLFEILVGRVSKQVVSGHHPQPDNTFLLQNTTMAPVIARMLQKNAGKHCNVGVTLTRQGSFKEERTPEEDKVDLKRKFLSDLVLLLNHNQVNRSLILQLSCWQDWLFALAHVEPANAEENRITDTVFSLFRMLLHHAFQEEREGWRIWVDTLAILHGKVSSHEGVKARDPSKQVEVTPCTAGSSGEESKTREELFKSTSEQPTLETKSTDSDADRRKFFQSLIQSKNGPKANEPLPTDTPEEKESNPSSPVNGKEEAIDSRNTEETSELENAMSRTRNEQENLEPVYRPSQQEVSLSVTGVDTELRGTEVAAELNVQGVDLPDTGLTVEDVVDKETKDSNVVESCLEENTDTKSAENAEALSTIEGDASSSIEKDEIAREVDDESTISPPGETEESADGMLSSDESKSPFASHSRRVKYFARSVEITEINAKSRLDQDLLSETERPRDVDSSLTIAVKSSYIGAAIENSVDAKTKSENKESGDPVEKVTSEGVGENDEQNGHAPKESTVSQFHTEASSTYHPHQPDSTKSSSETGAESGPDSSSSASAAARSEESSDQKSTYRAYVNIPEYLWSPIHQRLLGDLLFAFESDIQVWRSHNRKSVMDFVNAKDNATYLWNLAHFVSVLADNVIFCCGDLLPLLSSVTSRDYGQDVIEPCGGMSLETSFSFLNRLMSLVDVIVFTSSLAFSGVEGNRNLSTGGFLRQCLRLVFCCAARNRLVCRQRNRPILPQITSGKLGKKALKEARQAIKTLIASTKPPSEQDVLQNIPGHMTTVTDPEKLLQEMDVNRLRAVVYRDFEDSKQAQFLALTVVYFIAVMMVAKYRDLLRSDDPEARARYHSMTSSDSTATEGEAQNQTGSRSRAASWGGQRNASAEVEEDLFNWNEGMALPSLMKSAVDFNRLSLSEKLEIGFKSSGSLLKEILVDFSPFLSRFLVGSHGQELVLEGLSCQKTDSVVELVMLLCSQEWQNSLQRNGGMAFMELVNEGRLLSHAMRERIVMTTSEAFVIVNKLEGISRQKHMQFVDLCRLTEATYSENDKLQDQLLLATKRRDFSVAKNVIQKVLDIITSEHGAWSVGQQPPSTVQFYRLDMWEDDSRRRMRFVKNEYGSSHPEATLLEGIEGINKDVSANPQHLNFAKISSAKPEDSYSLDEEEIAEMVIEERNLGRDVSGHVIFTSSCHLIAPCVVAPGSLTVTSEAVFFTVDEENPEYQKLDPKILMYMDGLHGKWPLDAIKAVFSRRYLLQNCALELYTSAGTSVMLKFADQQTVRKVVRALPPVGIGAYYGIPQTRAASLYSPRQLFQKSTMTHRWQKGEVSNFQYLMFLNTIAGRSFCDLNQYPVFPWVLTNFEADSLDLTDPKIYRDLSKPIGALNPTRHAQFVERYASWDENDDIPPFHYGTHYSTCGFTLAWMIRVEPFATQFLNLQGGKFDHPGRTFCSIIRSWQNCQRDTSDVKELIPELFYLPEMFVNSSNFTFGIDDDGVVIDDVELPKWASTPEEFVMLHRAALESKYVSAHLHEWIDLIFGFKQKGPEAVKATNVFFHLTYEGSVDLDSIADPVMREAVEQQIKSFGQTPSQLLHDPHVPRLLPEFQNNEEDEPFKSVFLTFKVTPDVPVTHVAANTDSTVPSPAVVTISCNQCFSVNKWFLSGNTNLREVQVEQDPMLATTAGRNKRQLGEPLDQSVTPSACCFAVTADNKYIMACGYWDNSFKCFSADSGRLTQCVFGHWDVVTCLAYSRHAGLTGGDAFVVSGSRDATVLVWRWNERLQRVAESERAEGDNPSPLAILTGHEQPVVCLDVNASLGLVVSGSQEGACLLHTTAGNLLRTLRGPGDCVRPRLLKLSRDGLVLVNYTDGNGHLAVFTVNGRLLSDKKLDDQMLAVALNKDGNFFVSGGFSRYLRIWRTHDLRLLHTYPACDGSIRALAVSTDQRCLVAGLASGKILAIAVDFPGRL